MISCASSRSPCIFYCFQIYITLDILYAFIYLFSYITFTVIITPPFSDSSDENESYEDSDSDSGEKTL